MDVRIKRTCTVLVGLLLAALAPMAAGQRPAESSMSLAQIQQLVQIHAPDTVVAQAVRSRTLDFTLTPAIIDQLQKDGAGPETVAILRNLLPVGTLAIMAPPATRIAIDGNDQGATNAQGSLVLPRLPAGPHHLAATKDGYKDGAFDLVLVPNEQKQFTVALDWAGGYLTVTANLQNATIVIGGVGRYAGTATDVPCLPGSYDITVSAPGMKTQTKTAVVSAGQHTTLAVVLALDAGALRMQLEDAQRQLDSGDTSGAIRTASGLLALHPHDADAEGILARAYLASLDTRQFEANALAVIQDGGTLTLQLAHEHIGIGGDSAHLATLSLSAASIAYDPGSTQCKYPNFTAPLANIKRIEVSNSPQAGFLVIHHIAPGTYLLRIDIRNPEKPSDTISLSFAVPDSRIEQSDGLGVLASPPNSARKLSAIASLIRQIGARR